MGEREDEGLGEEAVCSWWGPKLGYVTAVEERLIGFPVDF